MRRNENPLFDHGLTKLFWCCQTSIALSHHMKYIVNLKRSSYSFDLCVLCQISCTTVECEREGI